MMSNKALHSANYFNDARDFWWHNDFLQLMANRMRLSEVKSVLDVGSGQGHWGLLLLPFLHENATLIGVEPEEKWRIIATENATKFGLAKNVNYVDSTAEALPFADNTFDLVTCQTLLIHVKNPMVALLEMKRVLKPNGLILASEPNNLISQMTINSVNSNKSIDEMTALYKFQLTCERGKAILNEGSNLIGDLLPYLFSQVALRDIQSYLSDMADFFIPPYDTPRQKAGITGFIEAIHRGCYVWDKDETQRYFIAGGGTTEEFSAYWLVIEKNNQDYLHAIENNQYYAPGGILHYLTFGRK